MDTEALHLADFAPLVGSEFIVHTSHPGAQVMLTLQDATLESESADHEHFSLQWSGPADPLLAQGTYRMEHPQLGAVDIFIVPLRRDAGSARYEAVFHVRRSQPAV